MRQPPEPMEVCDFKEQRDAKGDTEEAEILCRGARTRIDSTARVLAVWKTYRSLPNAWLDLGGYSITSRITSPCLLIW